MNHPTVEIDVLTLNEAAAFLRLSPETIERQTAQGRVLGQLIEGSWRFLHAALEDWLRYQDSRAVLLQHAGAFAGDDDWPSLLDAAYQSRSRPEVDANSWCVCSIPIGSAI